MKCKIKWFVYINIIHSEDLTAYAVLCWKNAKNHNTVHSSEKAFLKLTIVLRS